MTGFRLTNRRFIGMVLLATAVSLACGCAVSHKTAAKPSPVSGPLQTATKAQLIALYDHQVQAVQSLNAAVTMKLTAGSGYSGVIEQYHEVNGFVLAARPASIRVIGQAPVISKNIFDMVSDGTTFSIYIPSKNKFIVGPANLERHAEKPIENLRPQHLLDAFFWLSIPEHAPVLMEESSQADGRYYVLTVVRRGTEAGATNDADSGSMDWEIARKIWFNRVDLRVARIENFDPDSGNVASDVMYGNWQPTGSLTYPWQIAINRPGDDYQLQIVIKKLTVNEPIGSDRFVLAQPPGTESVHPDEEAGKNPSGTPKEPQP